jgi:hypothetical protein
MAKLRRLSAGVCALFGPFAIVVPFVVASCGSADSDGSQASPNGGSGVDSGGITSSDGGVVGPGGDTGVDGATPNDGGAPGVATALAVKEHNACLLSTANEALCWGRYESDVPKAFAPGKTWKSIEVGTTIYGHAELCGIHMDDSIECLGGGPATPEIVNDRGYRMITVGDPVGIAERAHRCAIATTGALYCWGPNEDGQLGLGDKAAHPTPTQVGSATDWTEVSAGTVETCGIRGGELSCWGLSSGGRLGDGTTDDHQSPTPVSGGGNVGSRVGRRRRRLRGSVERNALLLGPRRRLRANREEPEGDRHRQ